MVLSREEFEKLINKIDWNAGYPWKHELSYLRETDASQRARIKGLVKERDECKLVAMRCDRGLRQCIEEKLVIETQLRTCRGEIQKLTVLIMSIDSTFFVSKHSYGTKVAPELGKQIKDVIQQAVLGQGETVEERESQP